MKRLLATIIGLTIVAFSNPAAAHLVSVATSIPVMSTRDDAHFKQAIASAVADVLDGAIRFVPTVVTVHNARVFGDRLYILLLIADEDGVQLMKTLSGETPAMRDPPIEEPGGGATN